MIERLRIREELNEDQYEKVLEVIKKLQERFSTSFSRKTRTGEKISFIDVDICDGLNFDVIVGVRQRPFIAVEVEGKKAVYAFGIMKFILEEAGIEYVENCDGNLAYFELKRIMKARNLLDFLQMGKVLKEKEKIKRG
ncbi:hypothetical protein PNA2_1762 [Pyrococcus sp. NA2]|uniref:hypothetical protein n=1 Tax=Pyrococcus sp. (strain NA2) TaxID=342949 RepID=UPI000209AB8A|nr:hypothetical protein [Pyrococcus sp. NA2]AEC52677.1 hypothetical protein PNA2_1762 [Pyrococcus sp. NA2]